MKFLSTISEYINEALALNLMPYLNGAVYKFFGIADHLQFKTADGKAAMSPFIVDNNGNGHYVGPDDINDLSIYHKIDSVKTAKVAAQFGDGIVRSYNVQMSMIVFADRSKLQLRPDELAVNITQAFEAVSNKALGQKMNAKPVTLVMSSFIPNSYDVFNGEFRNVDYFLSPEYYLLKINYSATFDIDNKCFTYC